MLAIASLTTLLLGTAASLLLPTILLSLIVSRRSAPRYRYDLLMSSCWLSLLPASALYLWVAFLLYFRESHLLIGVAR